MKGIRRTTALLGVAALATLGLRAHGDPATLPPAPRAPATNRSTLPATVVSPNAAAAFPPGSATSTTSATTQPLPDVWSAPSEVLATVLTDPRAPQSHRDEAARRLLIRGDDAALKAVEAALESAGNRPAQLAAVRAIATDPYPRDRFVKPILALVGPDKPLTDAAMAALGAYKSNPEVLGRLAKMATSMPERDNVRLSAIATLGTMLDKQSASALVEIVTSTEDAQPFVQAAAAALAQMTSLPPRDGLAWRAWWQSVVALPDDKLRLELAAARAVRLDQWRIRYDQLADETRRLLDEQFEAAAPAARAEMIGRFLQSPEPEVRIVGIQILQRERIGARPIPAGAVDLIRRLVGDSNPQVRLEVASALRVINDPAAIDPLLSQLAIESDPRVRIAIVQAIAPIGDSRSIPPLIAMMSEANLTMAEAAANALREVGMALRSKENPQADIRTIAAALRSIIEVRTGTPATQRLREAAAAALAPLPDAASTELVKRLLLPQESPAVRRSALRALGEIGETKNVDTVVRILQSEADRELRREALDAFARIGNFGSIQIITPLINDEKSPRDLRDRAWTVFVLLMGSASAGQIVPWVDTFAATPDRHYELVKALVDRYERAADVPKLAESRQQLGEIATRLSRFAEAAALFRQALDHYKTTDQQMVVEKLVGQRLAAHLKARQYDSIPAFASEWIKRGAQFQPLFGPALRREAEELQRAGQLDDALKLITESRKIDPPLSEQFAKPLTEIESAIKAAQNNTRGSSSIAGAGPR